MAVCLVGGNETGREARWDVGPVTGVGVGGAVGAEAEAVPVGESPVCVAGARTGVITEDHGAEAAATDPENHEKQKHPLNTEMITHILQRIMQKLR